jgi:hypothetical protein
MSTDLLAKALDKYVAQNFKLAFDKCGTILVLYHDNEEIGRFLKCERIINSDFIQQECETHLTNCHGVIT